MSVTNKQHLYNSISIRCLKDCGQGEKLKWGCQGLQGAAQWLWAIMKSEAFFQAL